MLSLKEIQQPIAEEMKLFEQKFRESMNSPVPLLKDITDFLYRRKGKQMRPTFVFLVAKMFNCQGESKYTAASLIELLHTATLVHDDVVDDSNERRGFFSINAIWKNKIAVLVGDFLLSKGLLLSVEKEEFDLLKITTTAVREMSEGELLQIEKARKLDITEDVYFEIIRKKTAVLIASCCACGASAAKQPKEVVDKLWLFGEKVGVAFQIKDDLLDYGVDNIGKPTGIDIKEKKMTLPLIYALNQSSWLEKRKMIAVVKSHNQDRKKVNELIDKVREKGGLKYAEEMMYRIKDEAIGILNEFPDSEAKQRLADLVNFSVERKK